MEISKKKFFVTIAFILLLPFSNMLSVYSELPVIASRISKIGEINIDDDQRYLLDNHTLFSFQAEVEILNRDDKNQTVVEAGDCYPKVRVIEALVNQLLKMDSLRTCYDAGTSYSYSPSITVEYEMIRVRINQSGLSQLPDGNYTLDRPINTASKYGFGEAAEVLFTHFQITSGVINISYTNFTIQTPPEVSFAFTIQLVAIFLISSTIFVVRRKRKEVYKKSRFR